MNGRIINDINFLPFVTSIKLRASSEHRRRTPRELFSKLLVQCRDAESEKLVARNIGLIED